MDDKNLDKLFRAKFKAFREVPDEKVWTAIDRSLDKKRKKRIIPIWWKLGGVAAILAVALMFFFPMDDELDKTPTVTDTEQTDVRDSESMDVDRANDNAAVTDRQDGSNTNDKPRQSNEKQGQGNENEPQYEQDQKQKNQKQRLEKKLRIPTTTQEAVAGSPKEVSTQKEVPGQDKTSQDTSNQFPQETQLTVNEKNEGKKYNGGQLQPSDSSKVLSSSQPLSEALAQNDETNEENKKAKTEGKSLLKVLKGRAEEQLADGKKETDYELKGARSEEEGIKRGGRPPLKSLEAQTEGQIVEGKPESLPDSDKEKADHQPADGTKKSVLDALEERAEEEALAETSRSRWSAGPSIAPVYFDAMGEGSPIDPGFAANGKSGNTNFSYGLSVAYKVTEKLSLRSGIHKIDYGYDTNNVAFSPVLDASSSGGLENVTKSSGIENLAVSDVASESPESLAPEFSNSSFVREGTVAQQFGYLEIPLELDYALIDGKFGVNLVGGLSSLFLIDNSVTLNSGSLSTDIGEASNLNDLNFSTNIGFGMNYKVTPTIRLNVEPVFKYQLNTFSNVSGNFRPFSLGIYSGLNFRF